MTDSIHTPRIDTERLIEALRARAERAEAALVARHGGEPLALLQELDEARAEMTKLRAENARLREALEEALHAARVWEDANRRLDLALQGRVVELDAMRDDRDAAWCAAEADGKRALAAEARAEKAEAERDEARAVATRLRANCALVSGASDSTAREDGARSRTHSRAPTASPATRCGCARRGA